MKSVSLKLLKSFRTDHDVRVIIQSVKNGPQGFVSEMCKNVPLVQISNEELSFKAIYIRFFFKVTGTIASNRHFYRKDLESGPFFLYP